MIKNLLVELLDRVSKKTCRTELVMWEHGFRTWEEVRDGCFFNQRCRESNPGTREAFCGKCEMTGRYYLKEEGGG